MRKLLFVNEGSDDDSFISIELEGYFNVIYCGSFVEAKRIVTRENPDIIAIDYDAGTLSADLFIEEVSADGPPILALSDSSEQETALRAMRSGAADFIRKNKPIEDLRRAIELVSCRPRKSAGGADGVSDSALPGEILGHSPVILALKKKIALYAEYDFPVLILGESGTGKELAARALHRLSAYCRGPFVAKNCGAIPENLFESELFGTERGAFTDAQRRSGAFEAARGGSLLLDELASLPLAAQAKLLRAIEAGSYERLGCTRELKLNCRILASTNADISEEVRAGRFRMDLMYRLNTLIIEMPSLRQRRDDIPELARYFARTTIPLESPITEEALLLLQKHSWPGNVRELRNTINRAIVHSRAGRIMAKDIQFS